MRILLIEDDQLIGDGLNVGLGKLGFTVDWFTDGLDGREALYQAPYEAVSMAFRFLKNGGPKGAKNRF